MDLKVFDSCLVERQNDQRHGGHRSREERQQQHHVKEESREIALASGGLVDLVGGLVVDHLRLCLQLIPVTRFASE